MKQTCLLSYIGVLLSVCSMALSQDSASYRGPNRNGVYSDPGMRTNWKEKPPTVLWRKDMGYGFCEAAVAGKKLVTAGYVQDTGKSTVSCLDADTGKQLWQTEYADASGGPRGNVVGPVASPVIDDGRVYMVAAMGAIYCFDLNTGAKVWEKVANKDSGKMYGQFGDGASPVVIGDLVFAHLTTGTNSAAWFAYQKKDGALAWSRPVTTRLGKEDSADRSYSPVAPCKVNGQPHVLLISDSAIECVSLDKGALAWTHSISDLELSFGPFSEPVFFADDKFLLGVWYASKANLIAFQINNDGLTRLWTSKAMGKGAYTCVTCNGFAYGYGLKGLTCADLKDGKSKWDWRSTDPKTQKDQGEIIMVGDKIVWVSSSGTLYVGAAVPEKRPFLGDFKAVNNCGKDLKKDKAGYNNVITAPVLADGHLYLRASWGELVCVDLK